MSTNGVSNGRDLTIGQAAKLMRCCPRTATIYCDRGLIEGVYRQSTDRRIPRASLLKFMRERQMPFPGPEVVILSPAWAWRQKLERCLEAAEINAAAVADGFECGRQVEHCMPTVLVLDFSAGSACCEGIIRIMWQTMAHCQIVAIALEDEADPTRLNSLGAKVVFKRPCDPAAVADAVRRLLGERVRSNGKH